MDLFLIQVLSFFSVLLFVLGLNALRKGKRPPESETNRPGVFRWFGEEISALGGVSEPRITTLFAEETKRINNYLLAAALDRQIHPRDIRGLQVLAGLVAFVAVLLFVLVLSLNAGWALLAGVSVGLIGYCYPVVWLRRTAQRRQNIISKELPFAMDLLTVAVEAGQDFGAAVRHLVSEVHQGPLREEFTMALQEMDLGKSRVEGLRAMANRVQLDEFNAVVTSVMQSEELGSSVAVALKLQAEEIRRARFHRAERKAARAPSLMLIPVALFILPAVFIIILTPVAMRFISTMHSMK